MFRVLFTATAFAMMIGPVAGGDAAQIIGSARVIDGDTIELGVVRIRLHGIDAPEAGQRCRRANGTSWQCGTAAAERLAELAQDREVKCHARDRDAYGRVIGECFAGEVNLNATLVGEGLAWAYQRFSEDYLDLEDAARTAAIGIWNGEAEAPWDYRANRWERAAAASPRPGCPIKGNINRTGERIYHTPWSPLVRPHPDRREQGATMVLRRVGGDSGRLAPRPVSMKAKIWLVGALVIGFLSLGMTIADLAF